ncbi:MAG TPA: IPT/TIG domain-containing protein [Vicinamibacterales bacterium]|jgi:YD repeat-containing protein
MRICARVGWLIGGLVILRFVAVAAQGPIQYVYDDLGRLISVSDPSGDTAVYHYDAVGNLLSIDRHPSSQVSIISFLPSSGPIGSTVTIFGTGFSATPAQDAVTINGTAAGVTSATATQLVVTVPGGATTGAIAVTAPAGSATSATTFVVASTSGPTISSFSPGTALSGTALGIDGTNFDPTAADNRASLNASPLSLTAATTTHLTTSVPVAATSGRVHVSTALGSAASASDFWVVPPGYSASNVTQALRFSGFGTANAVTATFAASSNLGLLLFDGTLGQRVTVTIDNVTTPTVNLSVLSPFGVTLGSVLAGSGGAFLDAMTLPTGPYTYTLFVRPSGSGHARFTVTDVPPDASTALTFGTGGSSGTAAMSVAGQNGRFTFAGLAGHTASAVVSSDTVSSMQVKVLRPDGTTLMAPVAWTPGTHFIDAQLLPVNGLYTIALDPVGSATGSVSLTLYDATDQTGTITADGTAKGVTTSIPGQNVTLTFTETAGHRVSLKVGPGPTGSVAILDRDGVTTLGSVGIGALNALIEPLTLPADGTYSVRVNYSSSSTGSVTLNLYDVPADVTGTVTPTTSGTSATAPLNTPGQNALYGLGTPVNSRVSLFVSGGAPVGSVIVRRPDGTTLTSTSSGALASFIEPWTFASGQTIKIDPNTVFTGSVTIKVYDVPNDQTGSLTIGGSAVPLTMVAGQNAAFTFSGTAAQQATVHITGNTINGLNGVNVKLVSTDGTTVLASTSSAAASFNLSTVTLPSTGTYTIRVDPASGNTGSLNLSVSSP